MSESFDEIIREARALPPKEKATLARILIEELDSSLDPDVEALWIAEAERRNEAYLQGELQALPGEKVMKRARMRLK